MNSKKDVVLKYLQSKIFELDSKFTDIASKIDVLSTERDNISKELNSYKSTLEIETNQQSAPLPLRLMRLNQSIN